MTGLVLPICLLVSQAFAQEDTGRIRGVVRQRGSVDPLGGMPVTCAQQVDGEWVGVETTTDPDGHFACDDLAPGTWTVFVEADGFRTFETTEEVIAATGLEVVYSVERRSNNPYDVEVRADKPQKEVVRHELTAEDAESLPGTFGDIAAAVQTLPGVARQSSFDGDLIVRGTDFDNTPILLAGSNLVTFYHYGKPALDRPHADDRLGRVLPGKRPRAVRSHPGRRPAGQSRAARRRRFGGEVDVNLLDAGAYLETPVGKKASIAIAGRRSYVDAFLGLVDTGDGGVSYTTAPRYSDAELLFTWRPSPAHTFNLMGLTAADALAIEFANPQEISPGGRLTGVDAAFTIHQGLLQYDFRPSDKFSNEAFVGAGYQTQDIVVGTDQYVHLKGPSLYARDLATLRVAPRLELRTGRRLRARRIRRPHGRASAADDRRLRRVPRGRGQHPAHDGLRRHQHRWVRRRDVGAGRRPDAHPRRTGRLVAPREHGLDRPAVHDAAATLEARRAVGGRGTVQPTARAGRDRRAVRESRGSRARARAADERGRGREADGVSLDRADGLLQRPRQPREQHRRGRRDRRRARTAALRQLGHRAELRVRALVRHDLNRNLSGWISYTLSRAERQMSGETELRLFENDQTHIFQAVGAYRLPARFDLSSRVRAVTGNPTTPVADAVFVSDQDEFAPIPGEYNSDRLPTFFQLDVRVARTFLFRAWQLEAYLDVQNVTNRKNTEQIAYSYDYTEKGPATGLPILPALGVKASW
jgi:hypothetical protein